MTAICVSCRHFDPKPGLAREMDDHYGLCRWPLPPLPIVMLQHGLTRAGASIADRMIPHRGLAERPDLYAECPAFDGTERVAGGRLPDPPHPDSMERAHG